MDSWHDIAGWFSDADAEALRWLLRQVPEGGATAHVGVFEGRHLAACARVLRERRLSVLAVDTWRGSDGSVVVVKDGGGEAPVALREVMNWTAAAINFGRTSALLHLGSPLEVQTQNSLYAAAECRRTGRQFDLVFLDADHSYEHVVADIMAWRPLVKPGGLITGHDWGNSDYPGVERAATERLLSPRHCEGSQIWWWRAPGGGRLVQSGSPAHSEE